MQTIAFFNYPEFLLAGLLGIAVLLGIGKGQTSWHWPNWLAQTARHCFSFLPNSYRASLCKLLVEINWRTNQSFDDFACYKLYPTLLSLLFAAILPFYSVAGLMLLCWFVPDLILTISVRRRQSEIRDSLPQALDLLVLCVDAGLGLEAALQKIVSENSGISRALYDELNILSRDILLGMDRERAYQELYNRTGVDELKTFGSALTQASKLGLSISRILRAQSDFIRKKQSQKIEERGMKMPIYMAFPLWFCIMPSLMLLVLGPSLIRFYHQAHIGF